MVLSKTGLEISKTLLISSANIYLLCKKFKLFIKFHKKDLKTAHFYLLMALNWFHDLKLSITAFSSIPNIWSLKSFTYLIFEGLLTRILANL